MGVDLGALHLVSYGDARDWPAAARRVGLTLVERGENLRLAMPLNVVALRAA